MSEQDFDGLINNEAGLTLDEMRKCFEQDGWFAPVEPNSATLQNLLDLMSREARGQIVHHPDDPHAFSPAAASMREACD